MVEYEIGRPLLKMLGRRKKLESADPGSVCCLTAADSGQFVSTITIRATP